MRWPLLIFTLLVPVSAGGQAYRDNVGTPASQASPGFYAWSEAAHTNPQECLVNKKTRRTVCHTRAEWRRIAATLQAPSNQ